MFGRYISISIGLGILVLIVGGIGQWLHISAGNLIDWLIGIASFWWLLVIVTIPWNIYFDAREAIAEAEVSRKKGLEFDRQKLNYVQKVARWSLVGAVSLHGISAIALYLLAATGISNVGYVSSGLTLLLTILRPTIRGYQYLTTILSNFKKEIKYPREDALELRNRVKNLEREIKTIATKLDPKNPDSLVSKQQQESQENRDRLARLKALLEELQAKNTVEHEQLAREAKNAISQLNEDSQFLSHVREIIRFVKTA
ncbi:MAG: hypothetical protein QNJ41_09815 [Xenococcaceae cyanobacterium MO_188.B32]|nr:hypothetical protein [Xenococcaceae cyanobacterium MO_188.B32]